MSADRSAPLTEERRREISATLDATRALVDDLPDDLDEAMGDTRRRDDCYFDALEALSVVGEAADELFTAYGRLVAENERLAAEVDRAHEGRIEAQNPGIDIARVRADRAERRAAALGQDPEPQPPPRESVFDCMTRAGRAAAAERIERARAVRRAADVPGDKQP